MIQVGAKSVRARHDWVVGVMQSLRASGGWLATIGGIALCLWGQSATAQTQTVVAKTQATVRVTGEPGKWRLERDGQPFLVRGVGGDTALPLLAQCGGNSLRTWGPDHLDRILEDAAKNHLTVTAGIWLGQVRQGFDWSDAKSLIRQREMVRTIVERYKDHPALLIWALGNEMEDPAGSNGAVWSEINNLARLVKSIDPNHPTMTVVAELGGDKVRHFHALCPDIDILGINSYAGSESIPKRYRELGGNKPYLLTEYGPPGIWEIGKGSNDAYREWTSTEKESFYRKAYQSNVIDNAGVCLGSYAFLWGQKQEVTATWFSMLLDSKTRTAPVDTLVELWTGKPVPNRCPRLESLALAEGFTDTVAPQSILRAVAKIRDPENDKLTYEWKLLDDEEGYGTGGDAEKISSERKKAVTQATLESVEIRMPEEPGLYRLFLFVRDPQGGAAVGNLPIRVEGDVKVARGMKTSLPLRLYREENDEPSYVPSGWMGDAKAIQLDPACKMNPFEGETCMKCGFSGLTGWGGVVWQNPAQDWGDQRGGYDLSQAKRLVFYARGDQGNEEVSFSFGILGPEKKYHDTSRGAMERVRLTKEWKRYEIAVDQLASRDLSRIKTGFVWTVASQGNPVVFYLDNIEWQ